MVTNEYIEYNNIQVKSLYEKLLLKYGENLKIVFDDKAPFSKVEVHFLNSEVLLISVGARPGGRTEWYVELFYRNRRTNHSHWLEDEIYVLIQDEYEELNEMIRSFPKMEFCAKNNGFALTMNNHINLIRVFFYTSPLYVIAFFSFLFRNYELGWILFSFPTFFLITSFIVFLFKGLDKKFLEGNVQDHNFILENATLVRDKKEVKDLTKFTVYTYKNFLHIKTTRTFYIVRKDECEGLDFRLIVEWFRLRGSKIKKGF